MRRTRVRAAVLVLALLTTVPVAVRAQGPPDTDIWIAELDLASDPPRLANAHNVTARAGYDNQPSFEPDRAGGLLYTSSRDGQTDIYRLDLETMTRAQMTDTPESEYSATVMPGGREISVIRVEPDGTQRLWAFPRDGGTPRLLIEGVSPAGYHAWNGDDQVALFVLGQPATLQLVSLASGAVALITTDIGRSLLPAPGGSFSFLHRVDGAWRIRRLDPASGAIGELGAPIAGSSDNDMAWTPDGRMLMASGSTIHIAAPQQPWRQIADLSEAGGVRITRMAVNAAGTRIAFVVLSR